MAVPAGKEFELQGLTATGSAGIPAGEAVFSRSRRQDAGAPSGHAARILS